MKKYLIFAAILALTSGCTIVETGNIGIEKSFGKVTPMALPQGTYLTVMDTVFEVTTKEINFPINDLKPKSRDNLTLQDFDADIYFRVNPSMAPGLFIKYQGDYVLHSSIVEGGNDVGVVGYSRVSRAAREATYKAVATFDATTMHTKRAEIASAIQKALQAELEVSDPGAFVVTSVNVRNLLTDQAIENAIRAQVATDQEIARAAKQVVLAQAQADIARAKAQGQADANVILNNSLTPSLMAYRLAEIERDTIIASSKAGNVIIHGNATPLIQTK